MYEVPVDYSATMRLTLKTPKFKENPNDIICYLQVSFISLILTDAVLNSARTRKKINKHTQRQRSY